MDELPPYRFWPHFQAAFGGALGTLNLIVGVVSIARQLAHAFAVGISPVLKNIFAAYVQVFHGLVEFFASALSWLSGFDVSVPIWAHDWIILWFVMAAAAFRLVRAVGRAPAMRDHSDPYSGITLPPGIVLPSVAHFYLSGVDALPKRVFALVAQYIGSVILWPIILLEVLLLKGKHNPDLGRKSVLRDGSVQMDPIERQTRYSFVAIFFLQTLAIALGIIGLSVLNAQTMSV